MKRGTQEHPLLARMLQGSRGVLERADDSLRSMEVHLARGVRSTLGARTHGWDQPWDVQRASSTPCFTLSPGRAGTTTLTQLASLCPELEAVHEPDPTLLVESFLYHQGVTPAPSFWTEAVEHARDWKIRSAHHRGRTWFETNNRVTPLAGVLAAVYPQSRFVVLSRHPVDFAASALARRYYEAHDWDFARLRPRDRLDEWEAMGAIERVGWLWAETMTIALDLVDELEAHRTMVVQAEELFDSGSGAAERVLEFAGASSPSRRRIRRVLGSPLNVQSDRPAASMPDHWSPADRMALENRVREVADRLGYSMG